MSFRSLAAIVAGLLGMTAATPAPADPWFRGTLPPWAFEDALFLTVQLDDLSVRGDENPGDGGGATLDWSRRHPDGTRVTAGLAAFQLADSDWGYGRLRVDVPGGRRVALHGEGRFGPGSRGGEDFTYLQAAAGITVELVSRHLWLGLEDRYLEIDRSLGNLAVLSLTAVPRRRLALRLTAYASTSGNLHSDYLSGRLDLHLPRLRLLGGATVGRIRPELLNLVRGDRTIDVEEVFAGVAVPAADREVTVTLGVRELDQTRQLTLTLGFRLPVRSKPHRE